MNPDGRFPKLLNNEQGRYNNMPHRHNGQIRRGIIGALIMQIFAASRALVNHFKIFVKQSAFTTGWALATKTARDGLGP